MDVDERLQRGFEHCHEFRSSEYLVDLTHSDSKWLNFYIRLPGVLRALNRNKHVIHVGVDAYFASDDDITQFFAVIRTSMHFDLLGWGTYTSQH
jgi:hypothetical protein